MLPASLFLVVAAAALDDLPPAPAPLLAQADEFGEAPPPPPPLDEGEAADELEPDVEAPARRPSKKPAKKQAKRAPRGGLPELGPIEQYWPVMLDSKLAEPVDEVLWTFFVGACVNVPIGAAALPLVIVMQDAEVDLKEYLLDALIIAAVHLLPHFLVSFLVPFAIVVGGIATIALAGVAGGAGMLLGFGCILGGYGLAFLNVFAMLVNSLYCIPVANANALSRATSGYKPDGGDDDELGMRERRRERSLLAVGSMPY